MSDIIYTAWFIDKTEFTRIRQNLESQGEVQILKLPNAIAFPHVTHQYRPQKDYSFLYDCKATFEVTGYGNDGANEGVSVRMLTEDQVQQDAFSQIAIPHVTLSLADGAKAKDTGSLTFTSCHPFTFTAVYRAFTSN